MADLEAQPTPEDARAERRWARGAVVLAALVLLSLIPVVRHLAKRQALPAPVDGGGPLPSAVRAQVQAILDTHLEGAVLEEVRRDGVREFHIRGRARAPLAQDFNKAFRPAVSGQLMPLLRPYGEMISFDIASLDLPPARLRPLPKE
ncbi:hypothetical protein [Mesoterricola sediminis]|uniref:Uncharacterized protein n=1 Tax=Mesoterricola sediminis TaxID=2927980 RepID=A0AA48KGX3_9BACT|nr:hypothetical protein [Mesoterricola sediminis]BDU77828.1 hypothetical protein METESE_27860 [Mesoterricola sediminis]